MLSYVWPASWAEGAWTYPKDLVNLLDRNANNLDTPDMGQPHRPPSQPPDTRPPRPLPAPDP